MQDVGYIVETEWEGLAVNMTNDLNLLARNSEKKWKTFYLKARLLTSFRGVEIF